MSELGKPFNALPRVRFFALVTKSSHYVPGIARNMRFLCALMNRLIGDLGTIRVHFKWPQIVARTKLNVLIRWCRVLTS